MDEQFHDKLKSKMNEYVHLIYLITRSFPRDEIFGVTSQLRRAALSVILNYIEGFARRRSKVYKNCLEISFASLKESAYLLEFSKEENYIVNEENYKRAVFLADEIGAMLWSTMENQ